MRLDDMSATLSERRPGSQREAGLLSRLASQRGLTLVELLFVIVIFLILVALIAPALTVAKGKSTSSKCMSWSRAIGSSIRSYASNWDGWTNPDPCSYVKEFGYKLVSETGYNSEAPPWYVPGAVNPTPSQQRAESLMDFRCPLDDSPVLRAHGMRASYQVSAFFAGYNLTNMKLEANQVLAVAEVGTRHPYYDEERLAGHYVYADLHARLGYEQD